MHRKRIPARPRTAARPVDPRGGVRLDRLQPRRRPLSSACLNPTCGRRGGRRVSGGLRELSGPSTSGRRMDEGSLRCDANVSVRPPGNRRAGTKVEIKNMNSVRSLERALVFEPHGRSRRWRRRAARARDAALGRGLGTTKTMRSKEEAFDYRSSRADIPAWSPTRRDRGIRASLPAPACATKPVRGARAEGRCRRVLVADRTATACSKRRWLWRGTGAVGH